MNKFNRVLQHATSLTLAVLCTLAILAGIDGLARSEAAGGVWALPALAASAAQA